MNGLAATSRAKPHVWTHGFGGGTTLRAGELFKWRLCRLDLCEPDGEVRRSRNKGRQKRLYARYSHGEVGKYQQILQRVNNGSLQLHELACDVGDLCVHALNAALEVVETDALNESPTLETAELSLETGESMHEAGDLPVQTR